MREERPVAWHWAKMPAATLGGGAGVTPVQNTWYTVLDTTYNVRIKSIQLKHSNDESAAKALEIRGTIDGVSMSATGSSPASGSWLNRGMSAVADSFPASIGNAAYYVDLTCKSAKIEVRTTSVVGTNPLLFATVQYEQLKKVVK